MTVNRMIKDSPRSDAGSVSMRIPVLKEALEAGARVEDVVLAQRSDGTFIRLDNSDNDVLRRIASEVPRRHGHIAVFDGTSDADGYRVVYMELLLN